MTPSRIFACVVCGAFAAIGSPANGQERQDSSWLTGDALQQQLESSVAISWASEPLRTKLNSLADAVHVAIWLDRRIDPSQEPELSLPDLPLLMCLRAIAARVEAGVCFVGPVAYIGPKATAEKLATVAALRVRDVERLPASFSTRLSQPQPWHWPELTTPRELLDQLAQEYGVRMQDIDQIPHDLWAAGDLPPLNFAERMTLLLAGFDKSFAFQSAPSLHWTPLPENPRLELSYAVRGDPLQWISKLQPSVPQAKLERDGARIRIVGRAEDHESIRRLLRGERVRSPNAGQPKTVYTMKGPAPLGVVLKTLNEKAGLQMDIDYSVKDRLNQRVMFEVRDASLEELLIAVMKDTGLRYKQTGNTLTISP